MKDQRAKIGDVVAYSVGYAVSDGITKQTGTKFEPGTVVDATVVEILADTHYREPVHLKFTAGGKEIKVARIPRQNDDGSPVKGHYQLKA